MNFSITKDTNIIDTLEKTDIRPLFRTYTFSAILNMVVIALYNITDRIFIGQGAGALAICGLALTLPCVSLLTTIGTLTGVGSFSRISSAFSSRNPGLANRILGNALFLNIILSLLLIGISLYFMDIMLLVFGGSDATIPHAREYLTILIPGCLLTNLNFTFCNAIRASGFPKVAMRIILTGLILNIVFDPIFIFGFDMGIKGAAVATVLAMCINTFLIILHLALKNNSIQLKWNDFIPRLPLLITIVAIGMAAFIMNITTGMVNIIMNRYLVNNGGDYAIGAYGIISCYSILISMLMMGICQGMQPILTYNYAAGYPQRVKETLRIAVYTGSIVAILSFVFVELLAPWLVTVFTTDKQLIELSTEGLRITFLMAPIIGYQIIITSFFQSIRQAPKAIAINISRQFIFLVPALTFFSRRWGLTGIWFSIPLADLMSCIMAFLFFTYEKRRRIKDTQCAVHGTE